MRPRLSFLLSPGRRKHKAPNEINYGDAVVKVEIGKLVWADKHRRERAG